MKKLYLASLYPSSFSPKKTYLPLYGIKPTWLGSLLFCLGILLWSAEVKAQLLQQDFSSSTTVSTYVNAAPSNGQFNAISTSGANTVVSINTGGANNKLRFDRSLNGNAGSFSRTTDFSPTPSTLMYKFNLAVSGSATAVTSFGVFQIGSAFGTANSAESNANTYARFALNTTTTAGTFVIRDITNSTNSASLSGTQAITWVVNNSGAATTYRAPDGTNESIADDRADIWAGTVKLFDDVAVQTSTQTITDLKFVINGSTAIVDIDDLLIDPIPAIPPINAANPINSTSFTANWTTVAGVTGYRIDVSTASDFSSFVAGFENLYVAGQATNSLNITALSPNTTYYYRVRGAAQYTVGEFASGNSASQMVQTTAVPVNLSINDVSLSEGNAGTTNFAFTVSLSSPAPAGGVTFDIATSDGTASSASDFMDQALTSQTIPQGSSTYTFTVVVNGDLSIETNETFTVLIDNITGANIADGEGLGTIVNDDTCPTINITVTEAAGTQNDGTICPANPVTLATSGGGTYAWSTGANTSSILVGPSITTTYTVTVTNGSCVGTAQQIITVIPRPIAFNVTGGGTYCGVGSGVEIGLSSSEADVTYLLYRGVTLIATVSGTGNPLSFGPQTVVGTYTVNATRVSYCRYSMTGNAVVSDDCACEAPLSVNFTPLNSVSCNGATVSIGYTVANGPAIINTTGFLGTFSQTTLNNGTGTFTYTPTQAEIGSNLTIFASIADPDADGPCEGDTASANIAVNPLTEPTFSPAGTFCEGVVPTTLPTSSNNGIAGTWDPSSISTSTPGTYTFIFTPNSGQCADTASMKVTVNPKAEPVVTGIKISYCQGETPDVLPDELANNIDGTWSPTTVNTSTPGTTTYIFTPASGECADTASVKITVSPKVEPTFSILSTYCQGETPVSLPTTSNNGISGNWSPSTISTATPGTTKYSFFINENEECADSTSIKVVVAAAPDAPEINNITVCEGESTSISANSGPGASVSNTFTWDFEAGITGAGISQSNTVAANGATQTAGAGLTGVTAQAAGSGCSAAITSAGYDITNASLADAVADNEYFEFCVGAPQVGYTYQGVTSIIWGNRISGTGPINFAVVASNNLTVPVLSGMVTGTNCQMEGGTFTLNPATCYRIYYWGATGSTGTLRIDNMSITAQFSAPSGNYNFYDEDPALNANATPVATGTSYDPGTGVGTSDEVWVTCVAENGCESPATKVTVTVNAVPTLDIVQPESACLPTTVDATAVDLGESIPGGTTTYHTTADDAENDANPIDPGTLTALSSSRTLFVRYETTGGCFATGQIDVLVSERPATPQINDLVACIGESTTITPSVDSTVVVSWNFNASNTAGGSTDVNLATAGNASRGAGVGDAGFVSGCNSTSTAYSGNNWSSATEAEAISGNEYFEFPINILGPVRLTKFSFFERASGTGPISWALYVNGTKYSTGTTSDPCMQESRDLDIAICGASALIRIYAWRETSGGASTGTWRVDEVEATLEPAVLYNFYSDNTLTNKLAGPVASYTPELVDGEPLKLFVTAVSACASCESFADSLIITAGECTVTFRTLVCVKTMLPSSPMAPILMKVPSRTLLE